MVQNTLDCLDQPNFVNRHRTSPKAFVRSRKLPFNTLCLFLMNLVKGSLQDELDAFFQVLNKTDFEERVVTKSAVSQARKNVSPTAFIELSDHFLNQYYEETTIKKWLGFRLCAVDGSAMNLPDSEVLRKHFGGQDKKSGFCPMSRISECYDVLNGMTLDMQVSSYKDGERDIAKLHLKKTRDWDLMIYDRGYPGFWFFSLHRHLQRQFCMRLTVGTFPQATQFAESSSVDEIVIFSPNKEANKKCVSEGLSLKPIKLRLIKVILPTGEIEVLVTTLLDKEKYPHELFMQLYHERWGVEEDYKRMKSKFEVENFTGLTVHSVKQDVFAKVFIKNMTMAVVAITQPIVEDLYEGRKHAYKVNVTQAISKMKNFIIKLVNHFNPAKLFDKLVKILAVTVEPVRPNRSYPRKKNKSNRKHYMNYKRTR